MSWILNFYNYRIVGQYLDRFAEGLENTLIAAGISLVAAIILGTFLAFSTYVSHFANYNRVYGSLGAVVAFLFFIYLVSMVFLFGAEVASEVPRLPPSADETD